MISIVFTYRCDAPECKAVTASDVTWRAGQIPPTPQPPPGWVMVDDKVFCDNHDIQIEVTDKKVKGYPSATVGVRRVQREGGRKTKSS